MEGALGEDAEADIDQFAGSPADLQRLELALPVPSPGARAEAVPGSVSKPPIQDLVDKLIRHPAKVYETRPLAQITTLVIHHSAVPANVGPQQIANYHVNKLDWPGIGYHYIIAADGTIYQCHRLEAVSYHAVAANPVSVGVCFLGNLTSQVPPTAQLRSAAHLIAWLAQELQISLDEVKGHRELMQTVCPGNQWLTGSNWKHTLLQEVVRIQEEAAPPATGLKTLFHYLLFWAHNGTWAEQDWLNAIEYIAAFRPTAGFAVSDAAQAKFVTIVGGPAGVSPQVAAWLKAQGCAVERIAGRNEAQTRDMLNALVRQGKRFRNLNAAADSSAADEPAAELENIEEADSENMVDSTQAGYQVTLPVFEGPLDLLLHLIERQELDITQVSLAQVTNQYVEYIAQLGERNPDNLADFLVIAAKLLLIKSRVLLPQPPAPLQPDEEEAGEDLVRQLLEYKKFKEAGRKFGDLEALGLHSYIRLATPPRLEPAADLEGVTVDDLLAAVRRAMAIKPPAPLVDSTVSPVIITVAEQMILIEQEVAGGQPASFLRLLDRLSSRLEIIVTLLALLELIKQKRVLIRQEQPFADIEIVRREARPEDEPA
jgi:segregation and condensation protein A